LKTRPFYDAMNRALPEANNRPMAVVHHTIGVGSTAIGLLGATALLSGVSPWVGAAMIASSLPRFANERWFQRAWFHLRSARAPLHRELEYFETLLTKDDAAREIRLFGLADRFLSFGRALFERTWEQDRALSTRRTLLDLLTSTFSSVIFVGIHLYVGLAAVRGEVTVGDITLVLTAFRSGEGAISGLLQAAGLLYEDRLYLGHITTFEALSGPERTEGATVGPDPEDGLRFEHVTFRYPGAERDALSDLSLLPDDVAAALLRLLDLSGLQYGAADFIVTPAGDHVFLECNPAGEFSWLEQEAPHFPISAAIADLLTDAPGARRPMSSVR
jgi:ATP-binding cassette subfamily B protein